MAKSVTSISIDIVLSDSSIKNHTYAMAAIMIMAEAWNMPLDIRTVRFTRVQLYFIRHLFLPSPQVIRHMRISDGMKMLKDIYDEVNLRVSE